MRAVHCGTAGKSSKSGRLRMNDVSFTSLQIASDASVLYYAHSPIGS